MIGIIAAMDIELSRVMERMEGTQRASFAGADFVTGTLAGKDVCAVVCGVGKVSAAIRTQQLIDRCHPDCILHTGIAGSLSHDLRHLELVTARELTYGDMDESVKREWLPFGGCFTTDPRLTALLRQAAGESRLGCVVTSDRFICSGADKARLSADYGGLCAEMEGAAVAQTCVVNGVPFAVLRCISDLADDDATADYSDFEARAAEKAAHVLCKTIQLL